MDEPPLIIEPTNTSRPCTRSERPLSSVSDIHPSMSLYSASSTSRIGDLPTRLSGIRSVPPLLISHNPLLSLSPTSALLQRRKPPSAAKHGKGRLDMVVRYLLDSDSMPTSALNRFGFWVYNTLVMKYHRCLHRLVTRPVAAQLTPAGTTHHRPSAPPPPPLTHLRPHLTTRLRCRSLNHPLRQSTQGAAGRLHFMPISPLAYGSRTAPSSNLFAIRHLLHWSRRV